MIHLPSMLREWEHGGKRAKGKGKSERKKKDKQNRRGKGIYLCFKDTI